MPTDRWRRGHAVVWVLGALAAGSLGNGAPAQSLEGARQLHPGRVLAADGAPVAGAEVTFVSAPRLGASADDDDVVRTTSGADGRFRVGLWPGRGYDAWAVVRDAAGVFVSRALPCRGAATTLQLPAERQPSWQRCQLLADGAWRDHGPLSVQVLVAGSSLVVPPALVDGYGDCELPALPDGAAVAVRVFARDRLVQEWSPWQPAQPLRLLRPTLVPVKVVDAEGAAVPEAVVGRLVRTPLGEDPLLPMPPQSDCWPLAIVGADGCGEVLLAMDPVADFLGNRCVEDLAVVRDGIVCPASAARGDGRVVLQLLPMPGNGAPVRSGGATGVGARFFVQAGGDHIALSAWSPCPPSASVGVPPPLANHPHAAWLSGYRPELASGDPFRSAAGSQPVLVHAAELARPGGFALASAMPVRVQVLDASGGPAAGAAVRAMVAIDGRFLVPDYAQRFVADASGRVVLGAFGGACCMFVLHEGQWGWASFDVVRDLPVQTVRLAPLASMALRVVDAAGVPLVGVRASASLALGVLRGASAENLLARVAVAFDRTAMAAPTDREGRTVVCFVPCAGISRFLRVGELQTQELLRASADAIDVVRK